MSEETWRDRDRGELRAAALAEYRRKSGGAALTLTEFLLARIAEVERSALYAQTRDDWPEDWGGWWMGHYHHYRHHRPGRVQADCEAKRAAVDELMNAERMAGQEWGSEYRRAVDEGVQWLRRVVWLLATVYADHPDYREEWKP